jgi:hypothetical protein
MDHTESVRKFEHLMLKQADNAHDAAAELEALLLLMPSEKSRQLAQLQVRANHKQSKEFCELAQQAKGIEQVAFSGPVSEQVSRNSAISSTALQRPARWKLSTDH